MKPRKLLFLCVMLIPLLLLVSCSGVIGYSVVLWTVSEHGIADGTVVPVYLKSNIMKEYVIGNPAGDKEERVEVPFWMLSEPTSKSKAVKRAARYNDYLHQYAKCVLDGLPIRESPENGSKQVYRLRQDEIIRTLYKGDGVIPTNGKENLKGEWLRVLSRDGTVGWCFSRNLRLFTMNSDGSYGDGAVEAEVQTADDSLEKMLASKWYPDYYKGMIAAKEIDLDYVNETFLFDTGSSTGEIHLCLSDLDVTYPYAGVTKLRDGVYRFNGTELQVTVRSERNIVVQYTDQSGKPKSYGFVQLDEGFDVTKILADEKQRREELLASLSKLGPEFFSSAYGTLSLGADGTFSWDKYNLLVPSVIGRGAGKEGMVEVKYFLPAALKSEWDGVLTFNFFNYGSEVNLLYKKAANGLRLALARVSENDDRATGRKGHTVVRSSSSLVMFFQNGAGMAE